MIRKFAYLLALSRERHFGRAAQTCNISQPTLSNAIRQLEEELGVPIVERGRTFQGFTPEGLRVLESARRILGERESLQQDLSSLTEGLSGVLRIGVIPTAMPVVSHLIGPFHRRYPHVSISVVSASSRDIQRSLNQFDMDVGLTYLDNEPLSEVRMVPLYSEKYVLLTAENGKFQGRTSVTWAEAADLELCLLNMEMQNRRITQSAFQAADREIKPTLETNSLFTLINAARQGPWSSVVPAQFIPLLPANSGLIATPLIDPDLRYLIGIVYADRAPPVPLAKAFASLIQEEKISAFFEGVSPYS
jgi:DNA-binding transcriptional LysR family regulator